MKKEFDTLRQEILLWQQKRFTMVSGSILIVTAVLGLLTKEPISWPWELISIILLSFLFCACLLTWFFGVSNSRLGAYIEVFYENDNPHYKWHARNRRFKDDQIIFRYLSLNGCLALVYFVLGIISVIIPSRLKFDKASNFTIVLLFVSFAYIVSLFLLIGFSHPKQKYVDYWQHMKDKERDGLKSHSDLRNIEKQMEIV